MTENLKKCPYCGEEISATAKKCRYCGEWLDKIYKQASQQHNIQNNNGCLDIVWKTIVVVITIVIVLALLPIIGELLMFLMLLSGA